MAQGRLEAHSDHRWFASAAGAASGRSPFGVSLDGVWEFAYAKNPVLAVDGFQDPDYDVSQWDDIPVPAHIQFRGYDLPQYVNRPTASGSCSGPTATSSAPGARHDPRAHRGRPHRRLAKRSRRVASPPTTRTSSADTSVSGVAYSKGSPGLMRPKTVTP